jgi:uncharacterized lipoprotein YajG
VIAALEIYAGCADEQIIDAVPIHVPGSADGAARFIVSIDAADDEALTAVTAKGRIQTPQLE